MRSLGLSNEHRPRSLKNQEVGIVQEQGNGFELILMAMATTALVSRLGGINSAGEGDRISLEVGS